MMARECLGWGEGENHPGVSKSHHHIDAISYAVNGADA